LLNEVVPVVEKIWVADDHIIVYGAVPPVIVKFKEPKPVTDDGSVGLQDTPTGNKVITSHWFFTTDLVVVVVVYVAVGVWLGVSVGVGVGTGHGLSTKHNEQSTLP